MARGFNPFSAFADVTLDFRDHAVLDGAEVVCRMDKPRSEIQTIWQDDEGFRAEADLFRAFGDTVLVRWNLVDGEEHELPCNGDGMLLLPVPAAYAIVQAFSGALNGLNGAFLKRPGTT